MVDVVKAASAGLGTAVKARELSSRTPAPEIAPSNVDIPEASPRSSIARPDSTRAAQPPLSASLGLTTYRDQESGRVVVRLFDKETGDVLVELPGEEQRQSHALFAQSISALPRKIIDA